MRLFLILTAVTSLAQAYEVAPSLTLPPSQCKEGTFWLDHWYQRGEEHHNPGYAKRLRVNPPEVVLHEEYGIRSEAQENGLMLIKAEQPLKHVLGAQLYLEMWGGHPGTAGKRFTLNGRHTYPLPLVGTEEGHCTHSCLSMSVPKGDLVNGWNAVQLALDQGTTFWGHMMLDAASLRLALGREHPVVTTAALADVQFTVSAVRDGEKLNLKLEGSDAHAAKIARVDFQAWYAGYDDSGDRQSTDWHGYTREGQPAGHLGSAAAAPYSATWDQHLLPAQKNVAVRAIVHFREPAGLFYVTPALTALSVPARPAVDVALHLSHDLPTSFWCRNNKHRECRIRLDMKPEQIEEAELHVITWTGGAGTVKDYFTLNGQHFPVAEGDLHRPEYHRIKIPATLLKQGDNVIHLHSETEHHGIEIAHPGPALMVRYRVE